MIKYLGSKRLLLDAIGAAVDSFGESRRVLDLFSGTSRVGHALKRRGHYVIANDHLHFAANLARTYVEADGRVYRERAARLIDELNEIEGIPGYVTQTFCTEARYFRPENGMRIDAIRERIETLDVDCTLKAILLTSLIEAADRVDSTTGVQMAYLKEWAKRAYNPLSMRLPEILDGPGEAHRFDALDAAGAFEVDLAYLDPPYNQHRYIGNYHVWETITRWDHPEAYGIARKRIQAKDHKSPFNSKREIEGAMRQVLERLRAKEIIVSFNNEGYLSRETLEEMLADYGHVETVAIDFKRYVGAQIGIYNLSGKKVGRVGRLRNIEFLFIVSQDPDAARHAAAAVIRAEKKRRDALPKGSRARVTVAKIAEGQRE